MTEQKDQGSVAQETRPSGGETLLPCPFCGGRANIYVNEVDFVTKWSVGCGDCNCNMDVCEDTPADATVEWNARTPVPSGQTSAPAQEKHMTLWGQIAEVYGNLDAEDCNFVDREWARMRGYIPPTDGTSTLVRSGQMNVHMQCDRCGEIDFADGALCKACAGPSSSPSPGVTVQTNATIGDAIIAGIDPDLPVLEQMNNIATSLERAGYEIVERRSACAPSVTPEAIEAALSLIRNQLAMTSDRTLLAVSSTDGTQQ